MESQCVSSAGGKHLKQGSPPPPPPWDAMGTLAVKERSSQAGLLVVVGLQEGARMEPGSHAPHKNGSSPPGRQVGGDAAAMGLAQALVSSGLERG